MNATKTALSGAAAALVDGCEHVETVPELIDRLARKKRLRVKLGIDPTTPELHIGHAVALHKMQQFVEAGHDVILLIGDFTARIGDPSGRNELRPHLSDEAIDANMKSYAEQAGKVLDLERVTIRYNSEWLGKLTLADLIKLLSQSTVAQMLDRKDFANRYEAGTPIALHEFLYPVAQAYDSIALEADVELGGSDQLFNLLLGRHYQQHAGQETQICMTVPLLEGTVGEKKMSKSLGNHISITEPAPEKFGKLMRIPDELVASYARLAAFKSEQESKAIGERIASGAVNPIDEKKAVAEAVVALYHGPAEARAARERFERTVQRGELPEDVAEMRLDGRTRLPELLVAAKFAESKRQAERLIAQGGVRIDGVPVTDTAARWTLTKPAILSVGTRRFIKIVP